MLVRISTHYIKNIQAKKILILQMVSVAEWSENGKNECFGAFSGHSATETIRRIGIFFARIFFK
ncbi:MAG: hypothetical protein AN484_28345 [Aphanizomenon flos-aquae WA102]|uniref:Uncharacterized protein n=1 Tax=Aphanizomenon flos-aquae WA102 TaxID=1710896 RepID=A0A1B7W4N4_APHFL|nr:MAG: hypothetical protein AN484_28345 [Aphanizomenon flos-aquae WA102]